MTKSTYGIQKIVPEELKGVHPSVTPRYYFYQPAALSSETYGTKEFPNEKNLLRNFGRQNSIVVHQSSPDPYVGVSDCHQTNGHMKLDSMQSAEAISEMLNLGTSMCPACDNFSGQLENMRKYHDSLKLKAPIAKSIVRDAEAYRFPNTCTRRKLHKRPDSRDSVKDSAVVEDTVSPGVLSA
ncbi:hypothetical protein ACP4OV_017909 [Aristida adscensionis]